MKIKVKIARKVFPTLMLGLIAIVYILSFFCNSGFKEMIISSLKSHDHHSHDHHGHEHKHTHNDHSQSKDSDNSDNNCCNETVVSFFASFKDHNDQKISLSNLISTNHSPIWKKISLDKVSYSFKRFSCQFLKRKIPDIRILIQSFII